MAAGKSKGPAPASYILDEQVGFILRQVSQRHATIFADLMAESEATEGLTPTQFAALAKLYQVEDCSQNQLGRMTAMDAATIKGVVGRLTKRGCVETWKDAGDARRLRVRLSTVGRKLVESAIQRGFAITTETLSPLSAAESSTFLKLLRKMR